MNDPIAVLLTVCSLTLVFLLLMILAGATTTARTTASLDALSRKLNLLLKHHGINALQEFSTQAVQEVQEILREGPANKIKAVKRYRELTGAGLADAKAAVERIMEDAGRA